jgi:hypothetical protein
LIVWEWKTRVHLWRRRYLVVGEVGTIAVAVVKRERISIDSLHID